MHPGLWIAYLGEHEQEIARKLGMSHSTLHAIVKRGTKRPRRLEEIADMLGLPVAALAEIPPGRDRATRRAAVRALVAAASRRVREARRD